MDRWILPILYRSDDVVFAFWCTWNVHDNVTYVMDANEKPRDNDAPYEMNRYWTDIFGERVEVCVCVHVVWRCPSYASCTTSDSIYWIGWLETAGVCKTWAASIRISMKVARKQRFGCERNQCFLVFERCDVGTRISVFFCAHVALFANVEHGTSRHTLILIESLTRHNRQMVVFAFRERHSGTNIFNFRIEVERPWAWSVEQYLLLESTVHRKLTAIQSPSQIS